MEVNTMKKISSLGAIILVFALFNLVFFSCKKDQPQQQVTTQPAPQKVIVTQVIGTSNMYKNNVTTKLSRGIEVTGADFLETSVASQLHLMLNNGSKLNLEENTKVSLKSLLPKFRAVLQKGSILFKVEQLTSNDNFDIHTPSAVAGVRGTSFSVSHEQGTNNTQLVVGAGKVKMRPNLNIQAQEDTIDTINNTVSVDVEELHTANINQEMANQVNDLIRSEIKNTPRQGKININNLKSIKKSVSLIQGQKKKATLDEVLRIRNVDENVATYPVRVLIYVPGAEINVNGVSARNTFDNQFKPGDKLRVEVTKPKHDRFIKEYVTPLETKFQPRIYLKRNAVDLSLKVEKALITVNDKTVEGAYTSTFRIGEVVKVKVEKTGYDTVIKSYKLPNVVVFSPTITLVRNACNVTIKSEKARIFVNNKMFVSEYKAVHKPGETIKVKVEREEFDTVEQEYRIPAEENFNQEITLKETMVVVTLKYPGAKITINGKTYENEYTGEHKPKSKIKVKVEKFGYVTFETELTVPVDKRNMDIKIRQLDRRATIVTFQALDTTITVNGKKHKSYYKGIHYPGTVLNVKIELAGHKTFQNKYVVPDQETFNKEFRLELER